MAARRRRSRPKADIREHRCYIHPNESPVFICSACSKMPLPENISSLTARWKSEGVELLPPEAPSLIEEVFQFAGSKATGDILVVYQALGGMAEMDDEHWRLWSLQEIKEANGGSTEPGVLFSDYLLDCYQYRLKPVDDAVSEVWVEGFDLGPPVRIARSLEEFFASYIAAPDAVLKAPSRSEHAQSS